MSNYSTIFWTTLSSDCIALDLYSVNGDFFSLSRQSIDRWSPTLALQQSMETLNSNSQDCLKYLYNNLLVAPSLTSLKVFWFNDSFYTNVTTMSGDITSVIQADGIDQMKVGYIVSTHRDSKTRIWDVPTGLQLTSLATEDDAYAILTVDLSAPNVKVALGGLNGTIQLWDVAYNNNYMTLDGHNSSVLFMKFIMYKRLASAAIDNTIKVYLKTKFLELLFYYCLKHKFT